jgi:PBP1b-binding outer membrane lipoprotein LpoB
MTANLKRWLTISLVVLFIVGLASIGCKAAKKEAPPEQKEEMTQPDTTQVPEAAPTDTTAAQTAPEQ